LALGRALRRLASGGAPGSTARIESSTTVVTSTKSARVLKMARESTSRSARISFSAAFREIPLGPEERRVGWFGRVN